jgi:RNA polymerase sigma-70 factor (ECF subfamily)
MPLPLDGPPTPDDTQGVVVRDALERGFRRLPAEQRAVLVLHHYLDWSLPEIALTLGLPLGTVKSRLRSGTAGLRAALEADARPLVHARPSA